MYKLNLINKIQYFWIVSLIIIIITTTTTTIIITKILRMFFRKERNMDFIINLMDKVKKWVFKKLKEILIKLN